MGGHAPTPRTYAILTPSPPALRSARRARLVGEVAREVRRLGEHLSELRATAKRCELAGVEDSGFTYTGDDYSGLVSPAMYRDLVAPLYRRLYADNERRFMHSELLRAEHLRIARDDAGRPIIEWTATRSLRYTRISSVRIFCASGGREARIAAAPPRRVRGQGTGR